MKAGGSHALIKQRVVLETMGLLSDFVDTFRQNYRQHGVLGPVVTLVDVVQWVRLQTIDRISHRIARRGSENVYDKDWDVLILLDCCRIDMMREVRDEYDYLNEVGEHVSPGTTSGEWMKYTFTDEYASEMAETLHVTANTKSVNHLDESDFLHLEEVWRTGWDDEYKTIMPRTVTDRAIRLHRQLDPERTIVHYMQPHGPFIPFPELNVKEVSGPGVGENRGKNVQELAEEGYSREDLWKFHVENLRYVLDDLELLLENIDADRVVLSADHGQALGEDGEWGHYWGSTLDCLRVVPWCETSATDSGEYDPEYRSTGPEGDDDLTVDEKLHYLGYKPD